MNSLISGFLATWCALAWTWHAVAATTSSTDDGFQWATITDVNNPAYQGGPFGENAGRGSVAYEYRISRHELTSSQFLEFINTFWQSAGLSYYHWFNGNSGIQPGFFGPYSYRDIENPGMVPVMGLTWRVAAQYCNWLHNGKSTDPAALLSGAYDVSTFGTNPDGTFTDQATRSPGARYWIPSLDEWLKAVHYDPDKFGPGQGGWWESPNRTDVPLIAGPPGIGQTNGAGSYEWTTYPGDMPLSSYPDVQSPWGLWDASGGTSEWTEEVYDQDLPQFRGIDGSWAGASAFSTLDMAFSSDFLPPAAEVFVGLRIASAVPAPSAIALFAALLPPRTRRRKL